MVLDPRRELPRFPEQPLPDDLYHSQQMVVVNPIPVDRRHTAIGMAHDQVDSRLSLVPSAMVRNVCSSELNSYHLRPNAAFGAYTGLSQIGRMRAFG